MHHEKMWIYNRIEEEEVIKLSKELNISKLLSKVFLSRGINDKEYIEKYLNPKLDDLNDPFLLIDMNKAIERIKTALLNNERITIYGDYDVDGVTSTFILYDFLRSQGGNVDFYIPDRELEGYGLSLSGVKKIKKLGTDLIITVDCGVTGFEEVNYAKLNGIDIIITDHHECKDELPKAYAVINPLRHDCKYPYKHLAGVGVVYKLITGYCIKNGLGDIYNDYLDLVAIGTIADVVPILDENRVIVKYGLSKIKNSKNLGLKILINSTSLKDKEISSLGISFIAAPRINAAGRIGNACDVVRLFSSTEEEEIINIVNMLQESNRFRQETEQDILNEAYQIIENEIDLSKTKVIVLAKEGWHIGIIGIVASRLMEVFFRPCILISINANCGKGSGRSIEGFNIFDALNVCGDLLNKYGGHALAAGLSIDSEKIDLFRKEINSYAETEITIYDMTPRIKADCIITRDDVNIDSIRELSKLEPFGAYNMQPSFYYKELSIVDMKSIGEDKHAKIKFKDDGLVIDAIGFNMGEVTKDYNISEKVDVIGYLEINSWNMKDKVQLNLKSIRPLDKRCIENQYYETIEECIDFNTIDETNHANELLSDIPKIYSTADLIKKIQELENKEFRIVFLINSLDDIKELLNCISKNEYLSKRSIDIHYSEYNLHNSFDKLSDIIILVNPKVKELMFSDFDSIIFYGNWIDKVYLNKLLKNIRKSKELFCFISLKKSRLDEIVLNRYDLAAVYKFIVSKKNNINIDNIFLDAKKISKNYKIKMNFFKLKKSLEIFEELSLIKRIIDPKKGLVIKLSDNSTKKVNIEDSKHFMKLKSLEVGWNG